MNTEFKIHGSNVERFGRIQKGWQVCQMSNEPATFCFVESTPEHCECQAHIRWDFCYWSAPNCAPQLAVLVLGNQTFPALFPRSIGRPSVTPLYRNQWASKQGPLSSGWDRCAWVVTVSSTQYYVQCMTHTTKLYILGDVCQETILYHDRYFLIITKSIDRLQCCQVCTVQSIPYSPELSQHTSGELGSSENLNNFIFKMMHSDTFWSKLC